MTPAMTESKSDHLPPDMSWDKPRVKVAMVEDSSGFGEMLAACLGHQPQFEFLGAHERFGMPFSGCRSGNPISCCWISDFPMEQALMYSGL